MAIVKCPECRKPISDRARVCNHCGYTISKDASDEERERAHRIIRLKKRNRIQMIVYLSMIVFIAGVLFMYFGGRKADDLYRWLGYIGIVLGGAGYLFSRIQSFLLKRH
ncbi:zinc ribbon domain-containing protein [Pleionea sediminis]|uniref:zinc ribbon domain-containing protein n=1 Tax=Pleionea sediminis TaxID=2569479 RepID=UPI001184E848|nr:zinc ribbon domain-containing protein [Pleionea sediminis]